MEASGSAGNTLSASNQGFSDVDHDRDTITLVVQADRAGEPGRDRRGGGRREVDEDVPADHEVEAGGGRRVVDEVVAPEVDAAADGGADVEARAARLEVDVAPPVLEQVQRDLAALLGIPDGEIEVVLAETTGPAGRVSGVLQAIGWVTCENFISRDGKVLTPNLSTYLVPTTADLPEQIESIIVEHANPVGPWGVRGTGELPFIAVAPALVAAVHDATGIWFDEFPLTPERVLRGLGKVRNRW